MPVAVRIKVQDRVSIRLTDKNQMPLVILPARIRQKTQNFGLSVILVIYVSRHGAQSLSISNPDNFRFYFFPLNADKAIGKEFGFDHIVGAAWIKVQCRAYLLAYEVFLQKRSMQKDTSPGKWDSSASGHVDSGEDYDACALRELREEIGLSTVRAPARLFKLDARPETGQEFVWVYRLEAEGPFTLHPEEIETGGWFAPDALTRWMADRPGFRPRAAPDLEITQRAQVTPFTMDIFKKASGYYGNARRRAGRRKSLWNVAILPFALTAWAAVWYALFRLVWLFHVTLYPNHQLKDFWQSGIGVRSGILSFIMVFSIFIGAGAVGFMLTNALFWLIPWARKVFESEAVGHPETGFRKTMRTLFKVCLWTLIPGLLIAFLAAYFLSSLR